jgi:hypothetical protein
MNRTPAPNIGSPDVSRRLAWHLRSAETSQNDVPDDRVPASTAGSMMRGPRALLVPGCLLGIVVHRLAWSSLDANPRPAVLVTSPATSRGPGSTFSCPDPREDVFIVSGTLRGLPEDGSVHGPGASIC